MDRLRTRVRAMDLLRPSVRAMFGMVLAFLLAAGLPRPAGAQSSDDTGVIMISVLDASTKKPLPDARITLFGATQASALSNKSGIVKYTDVPAGLYRVRVVKSGFGGNTSRQFELLGDKQVDVDVNLAAQLGAGSAPSSPATTDSSGLKVIGRVSARVAISTRDIDSDSAIRRVSDSLGDALSKMAGVDVTQASNDPDAAQTISLNGHDESQTAVTLDGIPLGAPGSAVNLRSLNTDLFGGASVSFAAQAGSLGGSVNFRTLQPTQSWVTRLSSSYGTFDKFNYQAGETGSIGKLGIAVLHTLRESNNALTFNTFSDQSGLTYPHGGESSNVGNFLKLRYEIGDKTTLNFTTLQNDSGVASLCTQDVTIVPCGNGPGNTTAGKFQFMYGTLQTFVGEVATSISAYVNANANLQNDALRYVNGVSSPLVSNTQSLSRGVAFLSTLNAGRSTWTFNGSTYDSLTTFTPTLNLSPFVVPSSFGSDSQTYAVTDLFKFNDRLSFGPNVSLASTNGTGASLLGGLSGTWRPQSTDSYGASLSVGSSQPAGALVRSYSDPANARFNCAAATANVSGPGDAPGKQSAIGYDANWTHQWAAGTLSLDVYRQTQADQLINAQIAASSLGWTAATPYVQALQSYFASPLSCGSGAVLDPANVYVSEPIGDTTRVYAGFSLTGRLALGPHLVVIPAFQTNGATVTAADARLATLTSTTIVGAQIPGRPVHRGNLTLDGDLPHAGLELLANFQYVGSNNSQHIGPYGLLNLGASHALGFGKVSVLETNVFNTESGAFSSLVFAQPIPTSGGGLLYTAANPNPPRQFTVTYSLNTGAQRGAGGARPSRSALAQAGPVARNAADASPPPRTRGFGAFTPFPPPAGVDPLLLARKRESCTADDANAAEPVLAQLRTAVAAFTAGGALPAVDGLTIVPHGTALSGQWYLELRPNLPPRSRANAGFAPGDRPERAGRFDGPPGDGGGPASSGPASNPSSDSATPSGSAPRPAVSAAPPTHIELDSRSGAAAGSRPSPEPAFRAAFARFRAAMSCSFFTALTQADVAADRFDAFSGRNGLGYSPRLGLFVVRPPELGTGGGSLKHP